MSEAARRALSWAVISAGVSLSSRAALADELVRLDYLAPVGCPEAAEFMARVKQRVPTARTAAPEELARQLVIAVSEDEDGYAARLDFVDVRGETITRTLSGKTCDEVVTGIALVTALALEAQHEGEASAPEPAETPSEAPPAAETPPEPVAEAPKPVAVSRASLPVNVQPAPRRRSVRPRLVFGAGVGGGNAWYLAPGVPIVFDGAFRIGHTSLSGSARVGARNWLSSDTASGRTANFIGFAGMMELCPIAAPRVSRVRVEVCGGTTLGVLEGSGQKSAALVTTDSSRIFWGDVRLIARFRLVLTTLIELEAQGELGVPLRTHRFLFANPDQTVFEIPPAGLGWRAGVMLHFP